VSTRLVRHLASCLAAFLLPACGVEPTFAPVDSSVVVGPDSLPAVAVESRPDVPAATGLVRALTITDVSLFQAVRVPLLRQGSVVTARTVPVVAGRAAVVRVYVRPEAGFRTGAVEGLLTVRRGEVGTVLRDRRSISRVSRDESEGSVFQFALPPEAVGPDTRLSVQLLAPGGAEVETGVPDVARFPADGAEHPLRAQEDGGLDVVVVPFRWEVDGSGRLPSTSDDQIEDMRSSLRAMFPVSEVRVTVHEPVAWTRGLLRSGSADFGAMIATLRALRQREEAPSGVYYYGLVTPTEFFDEYCQGPCTLGQGYLGVVPNDRSGKVAAGLGYMGDRAAQTFVHELGHNHGRSHAPCGGAAGPDLAFPYERGAIGDWGYDERRRALVRPSAYDFMGYCDPRWISDYSYSALWDRIRAVNDVPVTVGLRVGSSAARASLRHRVLRLDRAAMAEWLDALDLPPVDSGGAALRWLDAAGRTLREAPAQVDALGDSDEVHVLAPPPPPGAITLEVTRSEGTRRVALPTRW
jgi:Peptidase M66